MIKLIKNKPVKLNIPKFLCDDNSVGEHLLDHPLTSLLNVYGFLCVIGRPGSGKTSMTISLITQKNPKIYKKTHHHIIVIMPQNSINSLQKNPFKVLPEENIYHELDNDSIDSVYSKIDGYSKNDEKTLLFIDDMTADLKKSKFIILSRS
jgi:GTPase SAR1 family protein